MSDITTLERLIRNFPAAVKASGDPSAPCTNAELNRLADKTGEILRLMLDALKN